MWLQPNIQMIIWKLILYIYVKYVFTNTLYLLNKIKIVFKLLYYITKYIVRACYVACKFNVTVVR